MIIELLVGKDQSWFKRSHFGNPVCLGHDHTSTTNLIKGFHLSKYFITG